MLLKTIHQHTRSIQGSPTLNHSLLYSLQLNRNIQYSILHTSKGCISQIFSCSRRTNRQQIWTLKLITLELVQESNHLINIFSRKLTLLEQFLDLQTDPLSILQRQSIFLEDVRILVMQVEFLSKSVVPIRSDDESVRNGELSLGQLQE